AFAGQRAAEADGGGVERRGAVEFECLQQGDEIEDTGAVDDVNDFRADMGEHRADGVGAGEFGVDGGEVEIEVGIVGEHSGTTDAQGTRGAAVTRVGFQAVQFELPQTPDVDDGATGIEHASHAGGG